MVQVTAGQRCSNRRPCPVCHKRDWCLFTSDGRFICCQRSETWDGRPAIRGTDAGWLFPLTDDHRRASLLQPVDLDPVARDRPPALPPELLDRIYRDLAALCGLREAAREDLIVDRRFPEALETGLYFSLPRAGTENRRVTSELASKYGEDVIASAPGFVVRDGRLSFRSVRAGREDYAVMGLDQDGQAFWGYTRRLPFDPARDDAKYMLLSSSRGTDASLAGLPKFHVAGRHYAVDRVWFTEGVIKAEIAAARLRCRVIGLYSTSVDRTSLDEIVSLVEAWGTREAVVAFDADKHELKEDGMPRRPAVLAGEQRLIDALSPLADVHSAEWDIAGGKGIDDLLTAGGTYRRVSRYAPPTPQPRVPRPCAMPGPVDGDSDLDTVIARTEQIIRKRLSYTYGGTAALIGSPPGSGKTGSGLRSQETADVNVFWAVSRHEQAAEVVERSRSEACQCGTPRSECPEHAFAMHHDFGRNDENCTNTAVIRAAQEAGYGAQVGAFVCGTETKPVCSARIGCAYYTQFDRPGSHAAPVETILGRPTSTDRTAAVLFDDVEGPRLVQHTRITVKMLERASSAPGGQAIRLLLPLLERALSLATKDGAYHGDAYDLLDLAARQDGTTLECVLAAVPPVARLAPVPSVQGYGAAPPGQLLDLIDLMHEEFPLWRDRSPFTSGLRLRAGEIDVARLRTPVAREDGRTALTGKAISVFSSTPDPVLRQWMGRLGLEVQAEYVPRVALPPNVRVIQDVGGFYGKGATSEQDNEALFGRAKRYIEEIRPERPAVITHKHLRDRLADALEIPVERVLYFGNLRGSNAIRDADALIVVGTPGMALGDAHWLACAAFRGEGAPPSRRMVMKPLPYGGWRDERGRGREIEVLTFVDPFVAEIYESSRRDELIQALYRCRPFDGAGDRRLDVVLLSAYPVAGLRVDELRFSGNAARSEESLARMDNAVEELTREGVEVTSRSLSNRASTRIERAQEYLREFRHLDPPPIEVLIGVGDQTAETESSAPVAPPEMDAQHEGVSLADLPCYACKRSDWWDPPWGGRRICAVCHPRPRPRGVRT